MMASRSDVPGGDESNTPPDGLGVKYSVWGDFIDALPITGLGTSAVVQRLAISLRTWMSLRTCGRVRTIDVGLSTTDSRDGRLSSAEEWTVPLPVQDEDVAALPPGGICALSILRSASSWKARRNHEARRNEYHAYLRTVALSTETENAG
jgi:hypothetical protein